MEEQRMNGRLFTPDAFLRIESLPYLGGDIDMPGGTSEALIEYSESALSLANGDNDDITLDSSRFQTIAGPSAAFAVSGFTGGVSGRPLLLFNNVAQEMTIENENAGSAAANRILTLTGADVVLRSGTSFARFVYNNAASRWILMSSNPGGDRTTPRWRKFTVAESDLTDADGSEDITLVALTQYEKVIGLSIKHSARFTGGTLSAMTVSVGVSGSETYYSGGVHDIFQATGDAVKLDVTGFGSPTMASAGHTVIAQFLSTGDDVADATAGSVDIWIWTTTME